jgi:hypothetical protein
MLSGSILATVPVERISVPTELIISLPVNTTPIMSITIPVPIPPAIILI